MQPFRPANMPSSDPLRFSHNTVNHQVSPHYYPPHAPPSNAPLAFDIKSQHPPSANFIKSKEEQQKGVPNGVSQTNVPFWMSNERCSTNNYHGT